jgi:8-oxo-dGTP diphosphatase
VWRRRYDVLEVLLVHRPKYDDWSFPKGKLDDGEDDLDAAVREVEEETGLRTEVGTELPSTRYRDGKDRPKVVRYWTMQPLGGTFTPTDEIDEIRWLPIDDAATALTYAHDVEVLRAAAAQLDDGVTRQ